MFLNFFITVVNVCTEVSIYIKQNNIKSTLPLKIATKSVCVGQYKHIFFILERQWASRIPNNICKHSHEVPQ